MENGKVTASSVVKKSLSEEFPDINGLSDNTVAEFIFVEVSRKRMQTVRMRMEKAGTIILSAPYRTSDKDIFEFIKENADWIYRNQKKLTNVVSIKTLSFVSGETVYFKGNPFILTIVPDRTNSLVIGENNIVFCLSPKSSHKERMAFFKMQMKYRLSRLIKERITYWEEQMALHCQGFSIKDMKSRWGSCDIQTGKLTFNLYLIEAPLSCVDYVVVHELAHLQYACHDAAFWKMVGRFIPDYKRIRQELNSTDRNKKPEAAFLEHTQDRCKQTGA